MFGFRETRKQQKQQKTTVFSLQITNASTEGTLIDIMLRPELELILRRHRGI